MCNRINTLRVQRPHKAVSSVMCIMCGANSESTSHIFLLCSMAEHLWNALFGISSECWMSPRTWIRFVD